MVRGGMWQLRRDHTMSKDARYNPYQSFPQIKPPQTAAEAAEILDTAIGHDGTADTRKLHMVLQFVVGQLARLDRAATSAHQ